MATEMNTLAGDFTSFIEGLGKLFGHNCEIALFKDECSKQKLFYSINSQVTGRKHGDELNRYELEALVRAQAHNGYAIFPYTNKDGRNIKAAVFILKDTAPEQAKIMIISFDMTDFLLTKKALELFCTIDEKLEDNISDNDKEDSENMYGLMQKIVLSVLENFGKPVSYLTKEDKVNIVSTLNDKGIFLIKGSVEYVAEKLCVSRYTVYNYLEEIRLENM